LIELYSILFDKFDLIEAIFYELLNYDL